MRSTAALAPTIGFALTVCTLLSSASARADEPEPTPMLPSVPAPAPVAPQHQRAPRSDLAIRPALGPRRDPALFGTGIALTAVGGAAAGTGLYLVLLGSSDRPTFYTLTTKKDDGLVVAGAITAIAGAVLVAIGIPMLIHNGKRLPPALHASLHASPGGLELAF